MCYASAQFDFWGITKIMAKNGKGKSSLATAYMWCLFNCDYELKDNPPVRRIVDGKTVDDMDTSVTLVFDSDGREVTMRKVQKRTYSKDGNSYKDDNKYFVNDVPKTLKDFNAYLEIDMDALKMCTNINAFLAKKPAEMREYLFGLVDKTTDASIATSDENLSGLAELLEKYTVDELSAMNKATKARVTKELPILDGQIKEKERDIQVKSNNDVSAVELAKNGILEQLQQNVKEQTDIESSFEKMDAATSEIMELKFKLSDIQNKANADLNARRSEVTKEIAKKQEEANNVRRSAQMYKNELNTLRATHDADELERKKLVKEWKTLKAENFDETSLFCKYCGQEYLEEKKAELRQKFENAKTSELDSITKKGVELKNSISETVTKIDNLEKQIVKVSADEIRIAAEIQELEKAKENIPTAVDVEKDAEWISVQEQISCKEEKLAEFSDISAKRKALKDAEQELRTELARIEHALAACDTNADEERLDELKEKRIAMEQAKADAERILDLLDELEKIKNKLLTEEINKRFELVKWILFEYAKNGNYKSVCTPTVDGKSILSTISNKGNRILGKLDICTSIQIISGINCPIWLDDTESLDAENQAKVSGMVSSQLIMLMVDDSDNLKIESEG